LVAEISGKADATPFYWLLNGAKWGIVEYGGGRVVGDATPLVGWR